MIAVVIKMGLLFHRRYCSELEKIKDCLFTMCCLEDRIRESQRRRLNEIVRQGLAGPNYGVEDTLGLLRLVTFRLSVRPRGYTLGADWLVVLISAESSHPRHQHARLPASSLQGSFPILLKLRYITSRRRAHPGSSSAKITFEK